MSGRYLVDTHLLVWAAVFPERLPRLAVDVIDNPDNALFFSVASVWEMAIKLARPRDDLQLELPRWHQGLLDNDYLELPVAATHALAVQHLPHLHGDPFDRLLLAQAMTENLMLLTADAQLAAYTGPILKV